MDKKVAILTANLGNFDTPADPVKQSLSHAFHRFDDTNFPPITGLTPRFQYRIPKMFGWQMFPGYDYYLWLDGSFSLPSKQSLKWFIDELGNADIGVFKHPWRKTIKEESDHIEDHLKKGKSYITSRYKNGLHKEQYKDLMLDRNYKDDTLYHSGVFIYRDSDHMRDVLRLWFLHQARYFTCDQLALPYVTKDSAVAVLEGDPYKHKHVSLVSTHK